MSKRKEDDALIQVKIRELITIHHYLNKATVEILSGKLIRRVY